MQGESPLIIGLEVTGFCITDNVTVPTFVLFKRPQDNRQREFLTYIEPDTDGNERIRVVDITHAGSTILSLLESTTSKYMNLAKRLHRFTHTLDVEMIRLLTDAGKFTAELGEALTKV